MILSHKHRFIFIKGIKVAGTSVEIALSQLCGPEDIITPITPADERFRLGTNGEPRNYTNSRSVEREYIEAVRAAPTRRLVKVRNPPAPFGNHMSLTEVLRLVPEAAEYRVLFVERPPYAKVMSFANWERHRGAYDKGKGLPRYISSGFLRRFVPGAGTGVSLASMVDSIIANGRIAEVRNIDRYRDCNGLIRGKPWRSGTLAEQLREFCTECSGSEVELVWAKRGLGSDSIDAATVLRPDQIQYINELFADEFAEFGFPRIGTPESSPLASAERLT